MFVIEGDRGVWLSLRKGFCVFATDSQGLSIAAAAAALVVLNCAGNNKLGRGVRVLKEGRG